MSGFYGYLESIMPLKRVLISLAVGMVSLFIVLISGLTSEFVRGATIASRTFSAFCFTAAVTFILMMSCEEYAIFKTKRELEHFIDDAAYEDAENFNRAEYFPKKEDDTPAEEDDTFRPMNFNA